MKPHEDDDESFLIRPEMLLFKLFIIKIVNLYFQTINFCVHGQYLSLVSACGRLAEKMKLRMILLEKFLIKTRFSLAFLSNVLQQDINLHQQTTVNCHLYK